MANKKIICSLLVFISINAHSQDSTNKNTGVIYKKRSRYRMDGHKLNEKALKEELYKTPSAVPYYKKYKTNLILSYCFVGTGAAMILISPYLWKEPSSHTDSKKAIKSTGKGLAMIGSVTGFIFLSNLKKAIRAHNEHIAAVY